MNNKNGIKIDDYQEEEDDDNLKLIQPNTLID